MSLDRSVGLVGLGIMGGAMARHLVAAGFVVHGYDPDAAARARAVQAGVRVHESPSRLDVPVVITSLPSRAVVEAVLGALPAGDRVVVETSTLSLDQRLRLAPQPGHALLDCPVSGTGAQMAAREAVLYASGEADAVARARPALEAIAARVFAVGAYGNGTRLKLVANHLVAIHNVATAEAVRLGQAAGIDTDALIEAIMAGAGASRIFGLRAPMVAADAYTPATMKLSVWEKDLAAIAAFADDVGAATPLFDATLPLYAHVTPDHGELDTAAVALALDPEDKR